MPWRYGLPAVDDRVAGQIDDRLAVLVVHGVARVADVPVQLAVGAEHEGVGRVVVLGLADLVNSSSFLSALPSPFSSVKMNTLGATETITRLPSTQMPWAESMSRPW